MCLPSIAPQRTVITYPVSKKEIVRESGDLLSPDRFDRGVLDGLKKSMGSLQFAGQFQQTPAPAEGIIFRREWLTKFYTLAPPTTDIQSWDMAFTKSEGSAKVAGFVMGKAGANIYIKDLVNDKMDFTESVAAVRTLSGKWKSARAKVVENKANGPAIVNTLKKEITGMIEFNPKGSKEERAMSVTPYFEAGNIWFPDPARNPWVEDLIRDLLMFPKGMYKDTVDALVQGILYLNDKPRYAFGDSSNALQKESGWHG
ncbi:hypothetical protein FACS1894120_4320 [Clostridia bacterium]|nr:hypothetical protein FACS1894120_4320 [Clostridia bacterium]